MIFDENGEPSKPEKGEGQMVITSVGEDQRQDTANGGNQQEQADEDGLVVGGYVIEINGNEVLNIAVSSVVSGIATGLVVDRMLKE